jgi:hypothetical protein
MPMMASALKKTAKPSTGQHRGNDRVLSQAGDQCERGSSKDE